MKRSRKQNRPERTPASRRKAAKRALQQLLKGALANGVQCEEYPQWHKGGYTPLVTSTKALRNRIKRSLKEAKSADHR